VFDQKDPIDLRSPEAGTLAAREEDDQYAHGKKVHLILHGHKWSSVPDMSTRSMRAWTYQLPLPLQAISSCGYLAKTLVRIILTFN